MIIEIPVFLSTGTIPIIVELQIRTIAMDFWASLEHKIFYKDDGDAPTRLSKDLTEAANIAGQLDRQMEQLFTPKSTVRTSNQGPHSTGLTMTCGLSLWELSRKHSEPKLCGDKVTL